ncbi:MAG: baseplate J/gp47 family protein [Chloroflexota bacterium]|nr:baseplate J/gp47 family protein [Chloroflexota bacterium]
MTVETASARRTVIELGGDATILDAARRLDAAESPDVVLVVPSGAPLTRNAVFLEALRRRAGDRRIVLVSPEARARSLASSVHMKAFSSISALDRHELDSTEHLTDARRAAMSTRVRRATPRRGVSPLRALAVFMSLVTAAGILLAVVGPSATIVIAATPTPLGPFEYDLRAGPNGGDIRAQTLFDDKLTAKTTGTATGSRLDEAKATGVEQFKNMTTNDIRIPIGTVVTTTDSPPIRFATTEEKVLPRSTILPAFTIGTVSVNIQAIEKGPTGNLPADKITRTASSDFVVTNVTPTTGGKSEQIPVVAPADYDRAVTQSDDAVRQKAEQRTQEWKAGAVASTNVYGVVWKRTGVVTPASEVVGKELTKERPTFEITVTASATAYAVTKDEPSTTAIAKLRQEVSAGMDLEEKSAAVTQVIGASVQDDGVHWRVRVQGKQIPQPKTSQMTAVLAGREYEAVGPLAEQLGFRLRSITPWPEWWPRLPVLDSRITIVVEALPPAASSP